MRSRWGFSVALLASALTACGGGDSISPNESFPDVASSYDVEGGFDDVSRTEAVFVGTLILTQVSRETGSLGGTLSFTAMIDGDVLTAADVPLESATITASGVISFRLASADPGAGWTFTGTRTGSAIRGRHTLTDGSQSFSGDWEATTVGSGASTGSLAVTATTSGSAPDPDGYQLSVGGSSRGDLASNGEVTVSGLQPGSIAVGLTDVASNCIVQGGNPRQAIVTRGRTTRIDFVITCSAASPRTGAVRVTASTTGAQPDPDGYIAILDGINPTRLPNSGSAEFPEVEPGSHTVTLNDVADNCAISGSSSRTISVTTGATAGVTYQVTCSSPAATRLAAVSGDDQSGRVGSALADPLIVIATDNAGNPIAGVTVNWSVTGGGSVSAASTATDANGRASVSRTLGSTIGSQGTQATAAGLAGSPVTFSHTALSGDAALISKVSGENQTGFPGDVLQEPLVVRVVDGQGNAVPNETVLWVVVTGGGRVEPQSSTTDVQGVASTRWRLGTESVVNSLSATVAGIGSVVFTATAAEPVGFNVELRFLSEVTSLQRQAFRDAAVRWQEIIVGDLPGISDVSAPAGSCGDTSPEINGLIDDLLILVTVEEIDGVGSTLAQAGPCYVRTQGSLPVLGLMRFDAADLETTEANGTLRDVVLHEMGHVLGAGALWNFVGLVAGAGGVDPHFTGTQGITAFNSIGGADYSGGEKVPLENTGGPGTADAHWRESVLGNELMTGFISGSTNPLSILTIGSFADLGYNVNTSQADPFSLLTAVRSKERGPLVSLGNDMLRMPVKVVDARGRVLRVLR